MSNELWLVTGLTLVGLGLFLLFGYVYERRDVEGHWWRRGLFGHWQKYRIPRVERARR